MNNAIKITIEEWAGDNSIKLTPEQINDLCEGIDVCNEMSVYSTGFTLGYKPKDQKDIEIENLKEQVRQLERYCAKKGYQVCSDPSGITEFGMRSFSPSHSASYRDRYSF